MMEGSDESSDSFIDIVLSWSLDDILDENFYQHHVVGSGKQGPQSFGSDPQEYFGSYRYPLLDETRAKLKSRMENMYESPFGQVISVEECAGIVYEIKVDCWRNNVRSEPHKTRPGDLLILADVKAETVSDLQKEGNSWRILIVSEVFERDGDSTYIHFKMKASQEIDVKNDIQTTPLFTIYLENVAPNMRIWKAMQMRTDVRWKVTFSDNFLKAFKRLKSVRTKMSIVSLLLKLSTGWRAKKPNSEICCESSLMIMKKVKLEGLYILYSTDIIKDLRYMQVLKVWDMLPDLSAFHKLVAHLDRFFVRYTDAFVKLCNKKYFQGDLEFPMSWPASLDIIRYKDHSITGDSVNDLYKNESSVEISKVSQSLLLMKFYPLSSGVMNHLLSDREGRELDIPFEVTDEEREAILYKRSAFIIGRSGTGKTTVLSMKLYQKQEQHDMAEEELYGAEACSGSSDATVLRQIFVSLSPRLCFAVKQHVLHLKSFSSGGSHSAHDESLFDMDDFDAEEAQFRDIPYSFLDIPSKWYPLFITFRKFLMMLDGSLSNSYFERILEKLKLPHSPLDHSTSVMLQTLLWKKEVNFEKFYSSYWPHFNILLKKKFDASRVFTEIISRIKGDLRAVEATDGKYSRDCYVKMPSRASTLSEEDRENVHHIFQKYEKMKMRNGEFDIADYVNDIHRRLRLENYKGNEMDFVYIDEVQDLTMSQIALFKHICSNVDEGFVFSGDTAQTISKGIDFRFEDIRHLFYEKFVMESISIEQEHRSSKGKISKMIQLSQNFRAHNGVLKLSQSIIDLLYHFFPQSIDRLNPETSPIHGETPVLLESGENESMIRKLFGSSTCGNIVGFGAEQVILVRDSSARNEISNSVGNRALVLTILECKGLEFQDVILYDFFGSSPLKNQWRLIYDYMNELKLLDPTLPEHFPSFDGAKHHQLCSELKQLYVAISRTRQRLWIYEKMEELCNPMFDYWNKKRLVQVMHLDDPLVERMKVVSTPEEWKALGMKLYHQHNYEMATMCFGKAHDTYWERKSRAAGLKVMADGMQSSNPEKAKVFLMEAARTFEDIGMANSAASCYFDLEDYKRAGSIYLDKCGEQGLERAAECFYRARIYEKAAQIFESIGQADSAAKCFYILGQYERAATIFEEKCGEPGLERAGECYLKAGRYESAADVYARGKLFSECLDACLKGNLFDMGLKYISDWQLNSRKVYGLAKREKGGDKTELQFLESCAFHYYHEVDDTRSKMQSVKDELLSYRKKFNTCLSSSCSMYFWEEKSIDDMKKYLEVEEPKKQLSVDSLVYFWGSLKDKIVFLIKYFGDLEAQDVNKIRSYGDLFLNYLGVWRDFHDDLKPTYDLLLSDAGWVKGMVKRSFMKNGHTIDFFQILSTSRRFWSSKLNSFSINVLNKLEELYKFIIKKSDSVSFQSWTLNQIYVAAKMYVVAKCVLESEYLILEEKDSDFFNRLKDFVDISAERIVALIFPSDWRKALRRNMVLLRQNNSKRLLKQVVVDYISSTVTLSYGQVGRLAVFILGSGSFATEEYENLAKSLRCSPGWKSFFLNMWSFNREKKGSVPVSNAVETNEVLVVRVLHQALVETYNASRRMFSDVSPNSFFYLIERLLLWVSCYQGYVFTTKSCFCEWLMQDRDTRITSTMQQDVLLSFEPILKFLRDVVQDCLRDKKVMIEWIKRFTTEWEYYSLLVLRLVLMVCLLYLNFGMCFDILLDLLWREHITEQLPTEFCDALRKIIYGQVSLNMNEKVNVLASAFKKASNELVVASFGVDCSRFFCSDSIFVDIKANLWGDETLAELAKLQIDVPYPQSHTGAVLGESNDCHGPSTYSDEDEVRSYKLLQPNPGLVEEKVQDSGNLNHVTYSHSQSEAILGRANDYAEPSDFDLDNAENKSRKLFQPYSNLEADEVKNSRKILKDFDHLWDIFEGLKDVKEIDQRKLISDATTIKLELEKVVFLFTSVSSAHCTHAFEQIFSGEVMRLLDDIVQLHAALDGSEQELGNKLSTVAQLCGRLQSRRQRISWPEKIDPEFSELYLEHYEKLASKALGSVVESGNCGCNQ